MQMPHYDHGISLPTTLSALQLRRIPSLEIQLDSCNHHYNELETTMLSSMTIANFKGFSGTHEMPFGKLTLIFGPNSAGKSSIIHSLALMKQSMEGNSNRVSSLVTRGDTVDLGTFETLIHQHDSGKTLEIGCDLELSDAIKSNEVKKKHFRYIVSFLSQKSGGRNIITNISSIKLEQITSTQNEHANRCILDRSAHKLKEFGNDVVVFKIRDRESAEFLLNLIEHLEPPFGGNSPINQVAGELVKLSNQAARTLWEENFSKRRNRKKSGVLHKYGTDNVGDLQRLQFFARGPLLPESIYLLDDGAELPSPEVYATMTKNANLIENLFREAAMEFRAKFRAVSYLGPLRQYPERYYAVTGAEKNTVGPRGENTPHTMHRLEDKIINPLNLWLERFDIEYKISTEYFGNPYIGDLLTLKLKNEKSNLSLSVLDVGFGVSQLLPILVEGLVAKRKTICVEQPEIHLHPKLQAKLAEFFCITSGLIVEKNGKKQKSAKKTSDDNVQWIVETHSEVILRKIQHLVKQQKASGNTIAQGLIKILYVRSVEGVGNVVDELRIDENGDLIDKWPIGFFDEALQELAIDLSMR